jgi:hypothetical protein
MKYAEACARGVTVGSETDADRSTLSRASVDDPPVLDEPGTLPEHAGPKSRAIHNGAANGKGALKRPNMLPVV